MVLTPAPGILKVMRSRPALALARRIAFRREVTAGLGSTVSAVVLTTSVGPGCTRIVALPVIAGEAVSVAVSVWLPSVTSVAEKARTPASARVKV